jgi:ATP-dependent Clp protease protease subunit
MTVKALATTEIKPHYKFTAKAGTKKAEIVIYGAIGFSWYDEGVSAAKFQKDLKAAGAVDEIVIRLNSEGGSVVDARAMYNLLVQHKARKVVEIDGIAASAASFLAMAGNEVNIAEGGFFMIHNARTSIFGAEAKDMRKTADLLDTVNQTIIDTYVARTGADQKKVAAWMDAETWFTGKEAVSNGFATKVTANQMVTACANLERTPWINAARLPKELRPNRLAAMKILGETRA